MFSIVWLTRNELSRSVNAWPKLMLFFGLSGLNETPPSIWPDNWMPPKSGSTQTGCAGGTVSSARAACAKTPATQSAAAKEITDRKNMTFDPSANRVTFRQRLGDIDSAR